MAEKSLLDTQELFNRFPILKELRTAGIWDDLTKEAPVRIISYNKGEKIILENRIDKDVFLLLKGKVGVSREGKKIAELHGFGHILGEIGVMGKKPRIATVTTLEPTTCLAIDMFVFTHSSTPQMKQVRNILYPEFFKAVSEKLNNTNQELVSTKRELESTADNLKKAIRNFKADKEELENRIKQLERKNRDLERTNKVISKLLNKDEQ